MEIPQRFDPTNGTNKVCKLRKAMCGRFTKAMLNLGYKQSQGDHTLFFKHSQRGNTKIAPVYVDGIAVIGNAW